MDKSHIHLAVHTLQNKNQEGQGAKNLFSFLSCLSTAHGKGLAFSNTGLVFDVFLAPVQVALSNMTHTCC